MDNIEDRYIKRARYFLQLAGQWPFDISRVKHAKRFVFFVFLLSYIIVQVAKIITEKGDFDVVIEILRSLTHVTIVIVKYCTYWIQNETLKEIIMECRDYWRALKSNDERNILQKHADEGLLYAKSYVWFVVSIIIAFESLVSLPCIFDIIAPLNDSSHRKLPLDFEYFVDPQKYYYPILFHIQFVIFLEMIAILAADVTYISIMFHVCGMFSVVGYRYEHVFDDIQQISSDSRECVLRSRIVNAIKHHCRTLEYVRLMVSYYSLSFAIQLFVSVLSITSVLLSLRKSILYSNGMTPVIVFSVDLFGHYFLLFLSILPAEKINGCSVGSFYSACNGHWYQAPVKIQKMFLLIMRKIYDPCLLSYSGVLNMTFEMYTKVLQLSFSYFTLICAVKK